MEEFEKLKAEYSNECTTEERKQELISMMQQNLKQRYGEESIECQDGKIRSLNSCYAKELYAINGELKRCASEKKLSENAAACRKKASEINKYGPNKPYLDK